MGSKTGEKSKEGSAGNLTEKKRADRGVRGKDVFMVPVDELVIIEEGNDKNLREDYGDLEELILLITEDIDSLPPLRGRKKDGRYIVDEGHRRRLAGLEAQRRTGKVISLPLMPQAKSYDAVKRITGMFVTNGQGKKLTMLEQAKGIKILSEVHNLDERQIAKGILKSVTYVRNCLLLLEAPADIIELMRDDLISPTLVVGLLKEHDLDKAVQIIRDTISSVNSENEPSAQQIMHFDAPQENTDKIPAPASNFEFNDSDPDEIQANNSLLERHNANDSFLVAPFVDTEPSQTMKPKRHISQKDINKVVTKHNSLKEFKKLIKHSTSEMLTEKNAEEFAFLQRIIEGDVSFAELCQRYFGKDNIELEDNDTNGGDNGGEDETETGERDELFEDAARVIVQNQMGSTSLIQRRLRLGYNRAGRIMDQLQKEGIVGQDLGTSSREVKFKTEEELDEYLKTLTTKEQE